MTSPKAIARSFTRYAKRHPDAQFRVLHFAQIPGTIKRSTVSPNRNRQLFRSKKLLVPMLIFADHVLPFVAASYIFTGRFNPQSELEKHPTVEATELQHQIRVAKSEDDSTRLKNSRLKTISSVRNYWALGKNGKNTAHSSIPWSRKISRRG